MGSPVEAAALAPGWILGREWTDGPYGFEPLRREDAIELRHWRNVQVDVLRQQRPLTEADQEHWYGTVLATAHARAEPPMLLVSMLREGRFVAYGGLTNLDWTSRRAEVSFLADPQRVADERVYAEDFTAFLAWLARLAFDELGLHRLFTETYAFRDFHLDVLERAGFAPEGRLRDHVVKNGRFVDSLLHGLLAEDR